MKPNTFQNVLAIMLLLSCSLHGIVACSSKPIQKHEHESETAKKIVIPEDEKTEIKNTLKKILLDDDLASFKKFQNDSARLIKKFDEEKSLLQFMKYVNKLNILDHHLLNEIIDCGANKILMHCMECKGQFFAILKKLESPSVFKLKSKKNPSNPFVRSVLKKQANIFETLLNFISNITPEEEKQLKIKWNPDMIECKELRLFDAIFNNPKDNQKKYVNIFFNVIAKQPSFLQDNIKVKTITKVTKHALSSHFMKLKEDIRSNSTNQLLNKLKIQKSMFQQIAKWTIFDKNEINQIMENINSITNDATVLKKQILLIDFRTILEANQDNNENILKKNLNVL